MSLLYDVEKNCENCAASTDRYLIPTVAAIHILFQDRTTAALEHLRRVRLEKLLAWTDTRKLLPSILIVDREHKWFENYLNIGSKLLATKEC